MDAITHIPTEAITIDIATKGIITSISIAGIIIGTGVGWSASVGARDIIAIGKRIHAGIAPHEFVKLRACYTPNVSEDFRLERIRLPNWA